MIIHRIADAIREQNWFTVIIEIMIVMIGIFLGLQVTEWNEDRKDRALEQEYLARLATEIHLADESLQWRFNDKLKVTENLRQVVGYFHGIPEHQNLTPAHCRAMQHSHRFSDPEADMPVVAELIATGNLDLITNKDIRLAITTLLLTQERRVDLLRDVQSQRAVLSSDFPGLIAFSTDPADIGSINDIGHTCDFEAMKSDQPFKNKLLDNISRNDGYMTFWTAEMHAYNTLHQLVDDALGVTHQHEVQ